MTRLLVGVTCQQFRGGHYGPQQDRCGRPAVAYVPRKWGDCLVDVPMCGIHRAADRREGQRWQSKQEHTP